MKSRATLSALLEMAAPTAVLKNAMYYHGTTQSASAEDIIEHGIRPGNVSISRGSQLTPVRGRIYLTPHVAYAQIYAVGRVLDGTKMAATPGLKFGWLFVVSGNDLVDVQPDEDSVGEIISAVANSEFSATEYDPWSARLRAGLQQDPEFRRQLMTFIKRHASHQQYHSAAFGNYAFGASAGKRVLQFMPDWMKLKLAELGTHVSHGGLIHVREGWRIDLFYTDKLKRDGSTFFDVAVQLI